MSEYQRRIVYLSEAQKDELFANGSITVDGVTIDYSDSDVYATPLDGPVASVNGKTGVVVLNAQDVGAYEKPATGIPASDLASGVIPTVPVQDVHVNGVSVVSGGVANVPTANASRLGAIMTSDVYGTTVATNGSGILMIVKATDSLIKTGTGSGAANRPIVPQNQHQATFYGLAKAAGDTTQSQSSNAVGTYTDSAKSAISQMLNSPVTITGSTPTITALPGVQYECGEVSTLDIILPNSGIVDVTFDSGSTPTSLTIAAPTGMTVEWDDDFDSTALDADTTYEVNFKMVGAKCLGVAGKWT